MNAKYISYILDRTGGGIVMRPITIQDLKARDAIYFRNIQDGFNDHNYITLTFSGEACFLVPVGSATSVSENRHTDAFRLAPL